MCSLREVYDKNLIKFALLFAKLLITFAVFFFKKKHIIHVPGCEFIDKMIIKRRCLLFF